MARSYSASQGLAHPLLIGALALIAMGTFFGGSTGLFSDGTPASRMEALRGIEDALAPDPPLQNAIETKPRALLDADYVAAPTHSFVAEALVLSRKDYRFDREAAVSPVDLMLGWGPMSNPEVASTLRVRQSGRFGFVRSEAESGVDLDAMSPFWTNAHLIPATPRIAEDLAAIAAGHVIRLEGALVNVTGQDGWTWRTSTSRTDKGAGACEVLLVTAVRVLL